MNDFIDDNSAVVKVELRGNSRTKVVHRRVVMPDNDQGMSGERCNQDQILHSEEQAGGFAGYRRCKHCFLV